MIWYFRKKLIRLKDQIQRSDSDLIFCDRTIHCWRRLSYLRPAHNELYLPKRCELIFMPNIINKNKMKNFKKPLVPFSHFWQDHCVYILTYVCDELYFWYLKRVVTQMSWVSSSNVRNISTWNNAFYYTTRATYLLLCCVWNSSRQALTKILEFH